MKKICLNKARIYTGLMDIEQGAVLIEDGRIADVLFETRLKKLALDSSYEIIDLEGKIITPGLIDTHIHGIGGFGTETGETEDILGMSRLLLRHGVTRFCPTLYPSDEESMIYGIRNITAAIGFEEGARVQGLHLEGPFISQARRGVQLPEYIKDVDINLMKKFIKASRGFISVMTVAPELKHMRELAVFSLKQGIVLSAGHTDATYQNMMEGMQAGILHSTHFFNAMRPLKHRDPGCVGAILLNNSLSCEIIADGFHVHPVILKFLLKEKPIERIILVTDALRPTGQTKGKLIANGEEVYLDANNVFRRVTDDVIAGSSATLDLCLRNLIKWGVPPSDAVKTATVNPSRLLKIDGERGVLMPGAFADLNILNDKFEILETYIEGKPLFKKQEN